MKVMLDVYNVRLELQAECQWQHECWMEMAERILFECKWFQCRCSAPWPTYWRWPTTRSRSTSTVYFRAIFEPLCCKRCDFHAPNTWSVLKHACNLTYSNHVSIRHMIRIKGESNDDFIKRVNSRANVFAFFVL